MKDTYHSIKSEAEGLFKDKGSKFIAYAYPIIKEEQVKDIIKALKKEHYSARHHCYAFRLGPNGEKYRASDDGEPSGTAGRPILGQLLSHELTNILVVVVRYFGGTLLGVSGLINAYKKATIDVLENAEEIEHIIEDIYSLEFEYPLQNSVMKIIKDYHLNILNSVYELDCKLEVAIRLNKTEEVVAKFSKVAGVRLTHCE